MLGVLYASFSFGGNLSSNRMRFLVVVMVDPVGCWTDFAAVWCCGHVARALLPSRVMFAPISTSAVVSRLTWLSQPGSEYS